MKQLTNENAANRSSYVGSVYNVGERAVKNEVLSSLPPEWSRLHREGYIHIHDLDAYGKTYNCLTFNFLNAFPYKQFEGLRDSGKIVRLFGFIKTLFADMGTNNPEAWLLQILITSLQRFWKSLVFGITKVIAI